MCAFHAPLVKQYFYDDGRFIPTGFIERGWEVPLQYANYKEHFDNEAYEGLGLLRTVMGRLLELAGPPLAGQAFTLTYAGPERHDGEAPYAFVVNGADIADARRRLELLPFFRQWCEERREDPESEPDVEFLDEDHHSHAGLFCPYIDLRHEQSAVETDDVEGTPAVPLPRQEG